MVIPQSVIPVTVFSVQSLQDAAPKGGKWTADRADQVRRTNDNGSDLNVTVVGTAAGQGIFQYGDGGPDWHAHACAAAEGGDRGEADRLARVGP